MDASCALLDKQLPFFLSKNLIGLRDSEIRLGGGVVADHAR
jgi:hypothetical protein